MKSESPTFSASPSALKSFFLASRPKTWIASISPVAIGAALAPHIDLFLLILTLVFALSIQIGTNFANDYFDFIKGADTQERKGPKRAVAQGWISKNAMWKATWITFAIALIAAIPLMIQAGLWSLPLALLCVILGVLYTGGAKPLGYLGLGEILVLIFFGPVATVGTYFLQTKTLSTLPFIASLTPALLSTALIAINNLRDESTDRKANKKTLIVRFGTTFGKWECTASLLLALACSFWISHVQFSYEFFLGSLVLFVLFALPAIRSRFQNSMAFQETGILLWLYTFWFCLWFQ